MSSLSSPSIATKPGTDVRGWLVGVLKMCGAGVWGLSLGVIGLWVLVGSSLPGFLGGLSGFERVCIGIGMLSGGQMLFLVFVAERIFPRTPGVLTRLSHWGLVCVGFACLALVCIGLFSRGAA